jgi:hypothetical protein
MKPRSMWMFALVLSLMLTACAPSMPAPTRTLAAAQSTLASPSSMPTPEPIGVGVPVIQYLNGPSELLVISSVTGNVFESFTPIAFGNYDDYAFAPDGHTLAVSSDPQLYLIDLPSWKYRTSVVGLHGSVHYSPDGRLLALAGGGSDGTLQVVDAKSGEVKASTQVGFSIRNVRFTRDGKAVMVYGPHLASTGVAANAGVSIAAPKAALFAASNLTLLWFVELNGVRDGTFPKKADTANTPDIYQPGAARFFQPGIAFAPDRDLLYVVHGDEDKLTTVDFTSRKVITVGIRPRLSWLDQLMALTAGVAHAKGMDGTIKQAVIAPDGIYLYVVGSTETVSQQPNGNNWDITDTSLGLEVIAAGDGALVDKVDTEANSATLSPDGRQLFLSGWRQRGSYGYSTPWTDVYDISSRKLVKHLDGVDLMPTHRLDGKVMLASSNMISAITCDMASVDPATWAIVSGWNATICTGWLIEH